MDLPVIKYDVLSMLKVGPLRNIARSIGIPKPDYYTKSDIIDAILARCDLEVRLIPKAMPVKPPTL